MGMRCYKIHWLKKYSYLHRYVQKSYTHFIEILCAKGMTILSGLNFIDNPTKIEILLANSEQKYS